MMKHDQGCLMDRSLLGMMTKIAPEMTNNAPEKLKTVKISGAIQETSIKANTAMAMKVMIGLRVIITLTLLASR